MLPTDYAPPNISPIDRVTHRGSAPPSTSHAPRRISPPPTRRRPSTPPPPSSPDSLHVNVDHGHDNNDRARFDATRPLPVYTPTAHAHHWPQPEQSPTHRTSSLRDPPPNATPPVGSRSPSARANDDRDDRRKGKAREREDL
ncbi:hypothetical protein VHUM_03957 [Vanrija humicola]|uniref:Uncharacterized protein n=1 Tax=Vanrija humicola TaxID=5417 RepID=A0A7D8UW22_VANHU|nr:hypothetical protein VHUM_03957 [Vanrija humicola]